MIQGNKPYAMSVTVVDVERGDYVCSLREVITFSGDICEFDAMNMMVKRVSDRFGFDSDKAGILYYCLVPNDGPCETEASKVTVKEYFPDFS